MLCLLLQVERDLQVIDELGLTLVQTPNTHCHAGGAQTNQLAADRQQNTIQAALAPGSLCGWQHWQRTSAAQYSG
jgi:hypothetical protein